MAKKRSKIKISIEVIVVLVLIALIAAIVCYFALPEFRKRVDDYFQAIFGADERGQNTAKGESELRVHYLDVGQGDSIFIEFPDDTVMLIDSGNGRNTGETDTSRYIVGYLEDLGVEVIDYLMLTHSDADHVGNMVQVLEAFEVEKAFVPYIEDGVITAQVYTKFVAELEEEKYTAEDGSTQFCKRVISQMGVLIESENQTDEFFMAFLSPSDYRDPEGEYYELNHAKSPSAEQKNAVSPIVLLEYMGKKIVFTGDVTGEPAEKVMQRYESGVYNNMFPKHGGETYYAVNLDGGADVYKAAHHGSMTHGSNAAEFIDFIAPKNAVICVGEGNSYNLPDSALLEIFSEREIPVYRTDENGTIVVTVYPEEEKAVSLYLTAQEQTAGSTAEAAKEGLAYAVSRRKITVNFVFGAAIA